MNKCAWLYKVCTGTDSSLERVLALTSKAALLGVDQQQLAQAQQACVSRNTAAASALQAALHASPFSMDIFRLRLLDAKRLGLGHEVQSAQGHDHHTTHWQPALPTHVTCTVACSTLCSTTDCGSCSQVLLTTTHLSAIQELYSHCRVMLLCTGRPSNSEC